MLGGIGWDRSYTAAEPTFLGSIFPFYVLVADRNDSIMLESDYPGYIAPSLDRALMCVVHAVISVWTLILNYNKHGLFCLLIHAAL